MYLCGLPVPKIKGENRQFTRYNDRRTKLNIKGGNK